MGRIIGVQFQKNGKLYYFDANGIEVKNGDYVIVDTARGYDLGEVIMGTRDMNEGEWNSPLKKAIRLATDQDIQHGRENRIKEKEAFSICQKKIAEHKLEMKLVSVEYAFDNSKILFFFTANGRVDFRSLVKDLASIFKMRIELRQIGVRDEAKMLGGLGPCGRPICCGTFLEQFQPVSIKMAKEQNLSLNPTKISGVCGRLMCCLKYEQEHYEMTRKKMPKIGREVITPDGRGSVTDLNIVKETVFVRMTNGDTSEIKEYPLENIMRSAESRSPSESCDRRNENESDHSDDEDTTTLKQDDGMDEDDKSFVLTNEGKQNESSGKKQTALSAEENKAKNRRSVLGQPVKRENPHRKNAAAEEKKTDKTRDEQNNENNTLRNTGSVKSPWAEALQKAIQAIDRDK